MKQFLFLLITICLSAAVLSGATVNFSGPDGTAVYLEKRELGRVPLTISVKPGTPYVFKYLAPGYEPRWEVITLKKEGNYSKKITLKPIAATVMITSTPPGAVLYINGQKNKATPLVLEKVPIGKYSGELRLPGFAPQQIDWEVTDERPIKRDFQLQVNNGKLRISSTPAGASILVNGKDEGFTPRTLTLSEGTYKIQLSKNGFLTQRTEVTVLRGKTVLHKAELQSQPGSIVLNSYPADAAVYWRDKKLGTTPLELKNQQPGNYTFTFRKSGFDDVTEKVTVLPGKQEIVEVKMTTYFGSLELFIKPAGVSVTLDGKFIGKVEPDLSATGTKPIHIDNLRAGKHTLKLSHPHAVPQEIDYEVEVNRSKQTLKRIALWIPNCEVTYIRRNHKEVGILLSETNDEILFSPEPGVQFTLYKKDISFRILKNH